MESLGKIFTFLVCNTDFAIWDGSESQNHTNFLTFQILINIFNSLDVITNEVESLQKSTKVAKKLFDKVGKY